MAEPAKTKAPAPGKAARAGRASNRPTRQEAESAVRTLIR